MAFSSFNTISRISSIRKNILSETSIPTNIGIPAVSNSCILVTFNLVTGATSYEARAVNGSDIYTASGETSPLLIKDIPENDPALKYAVSVRSSNLIVTTLFSTPINVYLINKNFKGKIVSPDTNVDIAWSGYTNISNSANNLDINSNTFYIDRRSNTGGIILNNINTAKKTYIDMSANLTSYTFTRGTTFYIKFNTMDCSKNDRICAFGNGYSDTNNFANIELTNKLEWAHRNGSNTIYDCRGPNTNNKNYHAFFRYDASGSNGVSSFYCYQDLSDVNIIDYYSDPQPINLGTQPLFNGFTMFTIGRILFTGSVVSCSKIKLYYINLIPEILSVQQMKSISKGELII
jgi:hypothetical protein